MTAPAGVETISAALARWVDAGACGLDATAAAFVCARVTAAGPTSAKEARVAASYLGRYCADRVGRGLPVDDSMFQAEAIAAYRAEALAGAKPNSAAACVSYLKRLAPGVGLRASTRTTSTATSAPATPAPATPAPATPAPATPAPATPAPATPTAKSSEPSLQLVDPVPLVRPEVSRALEGFVPEMIEPARFVRVRDLVIAVVRVARPEHPRRAISLARTAAYAAAWLDEAHRPLRLDVLLAAATIEEFLSALDGKVPVGSLATYASHLHALRVAHGIDLDVPRTVFGSRKRSGLYTPEEIAALYQRARRVPSPQRQVHVIALLDLVFGAGAGGRESAWVRPDDVHSTARGLLVSLADRRVLVAEPYAPSLLQRAKAAAAAEERYLIGGTGARPGRTSALLAPAKSGKHGIDLDVLRARDTWLAGAITDPRWDTPAEMLTAAGPGALVRLGRLATAGLIASVADPTDDSPAGEPDAPRAREEAS